MVSEDKSDWLTISRVCLGLILVSPPESYTHLCIYDLHAHICAICSTHIENLHMAYYFDQSNQVSNMERPIACVTGFAESEMGKNLASSSAESSEAFALKAQFTAGGNRQALSTSKIAL
jgi:hypothetical protein